MDCTIAGPSPASRARSRGGALSAWAAASLLTAGCASVLGVDKQYALVDSGGADATTGSGDAGSTTGIRCAPGNPCAPGTQECCFTGTDTLTCASTALPDPCPNGTDIVCDDPSDCASGNCCLRLDGEGDILGTGCAASCASGQKELCAPGGETCGQGEACAAFAVQPVPPFSGTWFYACQ